MDRDYIIELFGTEKYTIKNGELWTLCPNKEHLDHNIGNFSINLTTGDGYCFACGYITSVVQIAEQRNINYEKAFNIWSELRRSEPNELDFPDYQISDAVINAYKNNGLSEYAIKRTGSKELVELFGIYSDKNQNPIFTIKDQYQIYKAIWTRTNDKYYLLQPLTSKHWGALFGLHISPTEYTVIVEGFFDALAVYQKIGQRALALNGTQYSLSQLNTIKKLQPIVVMLDGDNAGKSGRNKLFTALAGTECYFCGGYDGDPDELSPPALAKVFEDKIDWFTYYERFGIKK